MEMKGKRERETAEIAAATAAGRARAPVGRDAWDEEEQGDGTVIGCRDWFFRRLGDWDWFFSA
jgi:hypothetical protein